MNDDEQPANRIETLQEFTTRAKRQRAVGIRQSFLQSGRGPKGGPGVLAHLIRNRDHLALDIYLLLLLRGRGAPHLVEVQSGTWTRMLDLGDSKSAEQRLSRTLTRLIEKHNLIRRTKTRLGVKVQLLKEDGSGAKYSPPSGGKKDPYFQLPLEYWLADHYITLRTPGKAMLLVALGEMGEFSLPVAQVNNWYGLSQETANRGLDELKARVLICSHSRFAKAPLHPAGRRRLKLWRLLAPYARKEVMQVES